MHRNTFLESPKLLLPTLQFIKRENLFAAGQITGTEGYAAAAAGGLLAGINASLLAKGKKTVSFPDESMIGSLMNFISNKNQILSSHKKRKSFCCGSNNGDGRLRSSSSRGFACRKKCIIIS